MSNCEAHDDRPTIGIFTLPENLNFCESSDLFSSCRLQKNVRTNQLTLSSGITLFTIVVIYSILKKFCQWSNYFINIPEKLFK